ncbi:MAG: UDP-N-acetylglucosamine 2-epimerase (non-hydrolyzing) [Fibrobacteres bacterium]|jgi:UDP-N-acetylglucosamine 2-epimerase (non-hydrolysing)|nr:UDP-N-acetylglucosamine 2-epimerase (non-hydrolyzing) [Fibrobacterota bacterium]
MKKVILVCGARPNFMKVSPIIKAMNASGKLKPYLVHTGQHYDEKMSKSFFDLLHIPKPDVDLGVGSGSHAEQTGKVMVEFEKVCQREKPDLVIVVGDVNSTMACTISAKKLWIPVAHVEAGLRSWDMKMPEEVNRVVTDVLCDLFFTTDPDANENLRRSGAPADRILFAGNVMIDTLLDNVEHSKDNPILETMGVKPKEYCFLTMHRPSNVDDKEVLSGLLGAFDHIQKRIPIVFPAHPRTMKMIREFGLGSRFEAMSGIKVCEPLDYHQMLKLNKNSRFALTDSGGLQEETTVLGIPCITMRNNTERPVTVSIGTSEVVGNDPAKIIDAVDRILAGRWKQGGTPEGWDGKAGERIVRLVENYLGA